MLSRVSAIAAMGAIAFAAAPASATEFVYTGGFQNFTAPTTGVYNINSYGAQGGGALGTTALGGLGARVGGDFSLTQGEVLTILVGGMGGFGGAGSGVAFIPAGGGGGGSFVYTAINGTFGLVIPNPPTPYSQTTFANTFTGYVQLADAGGGGGNGGSFLNFAPGQDGQASSGGSFLGGPGFGTAEAAGAGAGYILPGIGDGFGNSPGLGGQGGVFAFNAAIDPVNDGHGGFGGGGAGFEAETGGEEGGGGGGGGCTGGSGGTDAGGYGGYSCLADGTPVNADYVRSSGVRAGNGLVTIDLLPAMGAVPEPATWGMMILGMGAIGFAMRRQRKVSTRVRFA